MHFFHSSQSVSDVYVNIIQNYARNQSLQSGKRLHAHLIINGLARTTYIASKLIAFYTQCRQIRDARKLFDEIPKRTARLGIVLVGAYARHGFHHEAMGVFRIREAFDKFKKMLVNGIKPTSATISTLLSACAILADSARGKQIHGYSLVIGVEKDVFVFSSLIDMYAKCGFINEANTLFNNMHERNTITWNSMIFGFANHGYFSEATRLFNQMVDEKIELDHLTFTAVLTACSQSGMLNLGKHIFHVVMQDDYKIEPKLEHYACMVHLLGQEGKLVEAHEMINKMNIEPDVYVWGALLGACKLHGNISLAEVAAKHVAELEPESAGSSVLLSGLYADAGSWGCAAKVKQAMKKMKLKKLPGSSWIGTT